MEKDVVKKRRFQKEWKQNERGKRVMNMIKIHFIYICI